LCEVCKINGTIIRQSLWQEDRSALLHCVIRAGNCTYKWLVSIKAR
jgi:hypothetical protein